MKEVFISYRHSDRTSFARDLYESMGSTFGSNSVRIDRHDFQPGAHWIEQIGSSIARADVVIFVIGPDWKELYNEKRSGNTVDYVAKELAFARKYRKRVIPIFVNISANSLDDIQDPDIRWLCKFQAKVVTDSNEESMGAIISTLIEIGMKSVNQSKRNPLENISLAVARVIYVLNSFAALLTNPIASSSAALRPQMRSALEALNHFAMAVGVSSIVFAIFDSEFHSLVPFRLAIYILGFSSILLVWLLVMSLLLSIRINLFSAISFSLSFSNSTYALVTVWVGIIYNITPPEILGYIEQVSYEQLIRDALNGTGPIFGSASMQLYLAQLGVVIFFIILHVLYISYGYIVGLCAVFMLRWGKKLILLSSLPATLLLFKELDVEATDLVNKNVPRDVELRYGADYLRKGESTTTNFIVKVNGRVSIINSDLHVVFNEVSIKNRTNRREEFTSECVLGVIRDGKTLWDDTIPASHVFKIGVAHPNDSLRLTNAKIDHVIPVDRSRNDYRLSCWIIRDAGEKFGLSAAEGDALKW